MHQRKHRKQMHWCGPHIGLLVDDAQDAFRNRASLSASHATTPISTVTDTNDELRSTRACLRHSKRELAPLRSCSKQSRNAPFRGRDDEVDELLPVLRELRQLLITLARQLRQTARNMQVQVRKDKDGSRPLRVV
eukprot:1974402-Rhodomonas_salina.3